VSVQLEDAGDSVVDQATVTMTVDGAPATPLTFSKVDKTTTARWASPTYLPSGANLAVVVNFKDTPRRRDHRLTHADCCSVREGSGCLPSPHRLGGPPASRAS